MTRVLVTGAQGFIGQALVHRLLTQGLAGRSVDEIVLLDLRFDGPPAEARVRHVAGSITDTAVRQQACSEPLDAVFHLISVPGGAAERNYELGRAVNLDSTVSLLEDLRGQPAPPRFIFASTVAVYGDPLPAVVDESTLPTPALSYGAHKLACEALVADASRRGWVQGCSLRLPGVVARPGEGEGLMSAFMSQLFWRLAAGEPITVPVSAQAVAWWISVRTCVDNLCHAATLDPARLDPRRSYQLPVLRLTVGEVVAALAERFGADRTALVSYQPDALVERLFGAYPPLAVPKAEALGFRHDGDVQQLITQAMA